MSVGNLYTSKSPSLRVSDNLQVSGLEQFLAYKVGLVTGQFYEVLNNRDLDGFYRVVGVSTVIILCMVVVLSLRQFVTRSMVVGWRREGYLLMI